jgi:antitoxin VapB
VSEAERKRAAALAAASGRLVTSRAADVRWLLCGRGAPVDRAGGSSPYTVVLDDSGGRVLYQDIERSRVEAEERWEELGYAAEPYPWFEGHGLDETPPVLDALRLELGDEERERYRRAGAGAAEVMRGAVRCLTPDVSELDAAAELAGRAERLGFFAPVVLVGGEARQAVHRHPLPTTARLGRHALLAVTLEREGLHVSLTRIVSFGAAPPELARLVQACAEVDAAVLAASRPGRSLGELFDVLVAAYGAQGHPDEWRRHHQGGLTGYKGREVFAVPGEATRLPSSCAVAWNPSIAGGGKSEDTALVSVDGAEVVTRTPDLGELETAGFARPAIVEL